MVMPPEVAREINLRCLSDANDMHNDAMNAAKQAEETCGLVCRGVGWM
jgi:hypothetical protein